MTVVHVFAGGNPVSAGRITHLPSAYLVVAADSGADTAAAIGATVDVLAGDLDSITRRTLDVIIDSGTTIEAHPSDKNATDLDLALGVAQRLGADEIVVIGGGGSRLDHLLGNVAVISARTMQEVQVRWVLDRETAYVVHDRRSIPVAVGATFSVIPVGGDAHGVTVTGSKWTLDNATLKAGTSLGIINLAQAPQLEVAVRSGNLLVVVNHCPEG
ncbi:MAG: thiamine diphosphokinase [bacterium]|nr:thiamine diphosphokinase [bacterium]